MRAQFSCDLAGQAADLPHFWEHTIGSGHATLALRADWQAQMKQTHSELGMRHVRFHGILDDDMGTLVSEGDTFFYSFYNIDKIFDFLLATGMRPFVELSFMPSALASGDQTVFHYRANVSQPKNYTQWAVLIRKLVQHWVDRYGLGEVRHWFFEVLRRPDLWCTNRLGHVASIAAKAQKLFPTIDFTPEFVWSGCFGESPNGLPAIGPIQDLSRCYAVLGFGRNGIIFSMRAPQLVSRHIQGLKDPDAELFSL
jgi:Glycosyl hydrolases family 39